MVERNTPEARPPVNPGVFNRQLTAGVWRATEDELEAQVYCLDSWSERTVRFRVGVGDLRVRYAEAVLHRSEGGQAGGKREVPELYGLTAYLGAGKQFRQALAGRQDRDHWLALFLEGVKAVIQAEYWVYKERGYASAEDYERYFTDEFAATCLYYSQPPGVVESWVVYVSDQVREDCLFLRQRAARVHVGSNAFVNAQMIDSFHELVLSLNLGPGGLIVGAEAQINRVPDKVCRLAATRADGLVGLTLETADRHHLARLLGGPNGCTHLADLAVDAVSLARTALSQSVGHPSCDAS